jgi:hypothetical protein
VCRYGAVYIRLERVRTKLLSREYVRFLPNSGWLPSCAMGGEHTDLITLDVGFPGVCPSYVHKFNGCVVTAYFSKQAVVY